MQYVLSEQEYNILQHNKNQAEKRLNDAVKVAAKNMSSEIRGRAYGGRVELDQELFIGLINQFKQDVLKELGTTPAIINPDTTKK